MSKNTSEEPTATVKITAREAMTIYNRHYIDLEIRDFVIPEAEQIKKVRYWRRLADRLIAKGAVKHPA